MDDWDIPFPKILRIYQWIGKNRMDVEKNKMNPLKIVPVSQNICPKGAEDIYS